MMTDREKVISAAWSLYAAPPRELVTTPGYCLKAVRLILEKAFDMAPGELYAKFVTEWTQPIGYDKRHGHWAVDASLSLELLHMRIMPQQVRPGDLIFFDNTAQLTKETWATWYPNKPYEKVYYGHVGVILSNTEFLEQVNPGFRAGRLVENKGAMCITQLTKVKGASSFIRFTPDRGLVT